MITDHEFTEFILGSASTGDRCVACGEVEAEHDYDPTPEYFTYDGPRANTEFESARFEMGE